MFPTRLSSHWIHFQISIQDDSHFLLPYLQRPDLFQKWEVKRERRLENIVHYNQKKFNYGLQQVQDRKCEHTFTIMIASIQKLFDPLVNRHLPFSLFSGQLISRAVVSFIFDVPCNPLIQASKIHDIHICVRMLREFLIQLCIPIRNILNTEEVTKNNQKIQLMHQGFDVWRLPLLPRILQ